MACTDVRSWTSTDTKFPLFLGKVADVTHGKYCKGANTQFFELGIVHPNPYHCVPFPCTPDTLLAMRLVYLLERFLYRFVADGHSSLKNHVSMHKFRFEVTDEHGFNCNEAAHGVGRCSDGSMD